MEDKQAIMELQMIRDNRQVTKRRKVKMTSLEKEIEDD